jgi:hypothetical protein
VTIIWETTGKITDVRLEYSLDAGCIEIFNSTPNTGSYTWVIPESAEGNIRIRITDASDAEISDESDSIIVVQPVSVHDYHRQASPRIALIPQGSMQMSTGEKFNGQKIVILDLKGKAIPESCPLRGKAVFLLEKK